MLVSKLKKTFPAPDMPTQRLIESEVMIFCSNEYVTKESMKKLESRIARKLNQPLSEAVSERKNTDGDLFTGKRKVA